MADLIVLALGGGLFGLLCLYAYVLRKVWPWSSPSSTPPPRSGSASTWSPPCCAPTGS